MIPRITKAPIKGKRVIVRCDFDVVKNATIKDDFRLQRSIQTIEYLIQRKAQQIILIAHAGKPHDQDPSLSLEPVRGWLSRRLKQPIPLVSIDSDYTAPIVLLENLRYECGETTNSMRLARRIARHGDIYINDAFATSHRRHASIVRLPQLLPSFAGFALLNEIEVLSSMINKPQRPFHVVVGFAKLADKLRILTTLMEKADSVLIGGGIAFTFLQAQGFSIGRSIVDATAIEKTKQLLKRYGHKIVLPVDIVVAQSPSDSASVVDIEHIPSHSMGLDIGPKTRKLFVQHLNDARCIFWNGPMGMFEYSPFDAGTTHLARYLARCDAQTIVGGGDTLKAIRCARVLSSISHASTGGGACLAFIKGDTLPGIQALINCRA